MQERFESFLEPIRDAISQAIEELNLTTKRVFEFLMMFLVLRMV